MNKPAYKKYLEPDRFIFILIFLLLIERIAAFFIIGPEGTSNSDDIGYLKSGIYFAQHGVITIWSEKPTAIIMPAMTLITGAFCKIFGESLAFLAALKCLWIVMGLFTAYFTYKMVSVFLPKWYGILAAATFLLPNFAWMDNMILTETPYLLFHTMCLYYTFKMGQDKDKKYFIGYIAAFLLALSFRANILTMPIFTAVYLLIKKTYSGKELLRRLLSFACASMIFFVPWTIRNYIRFDAFIPVSYGAADPTLKGTYQGVGYPLDEELDYQTNVVDVLHEQYADYYNEDGSLKNPDQEYYLADMGKAIAVKYRISEWIKNDPGSFFKSYFILKPYSTLNWIWYWGPYDNIVIPLLSVISKINCLLCAVSVLLALITKKNRLPAMFFAGIYLVNLYIMSMSMVLERYAAMLMPLRYIISIIGIWIVVDSIKERKNKKAALQS